MAPAKQRQTRTSLSSLDTNAAGNGAATDTSSSAYHTARSTLHSRQTSSEVDDRRTNRSRSRTESSGSFDAAQRDLAHLLYTNRSLAHHSKPVSIRSSMSSSTSSSPHELDHSAGLPFFAAPPPRQLASSRTITAHMITSPASKENIRPRADQPHKLRSRLGPAVTLGASDKDPNRPFIQAAPGAGVKALSQEVQTRHVRLSNASAGTRPLGFPYSASMIAASAAVADDRDHKLKMLVRGPGMPSKTGRSEKRKTTGSGKEGSLESHRSSSDVDLDLNFDLPKEGQIRFEQAGNRCDMEMSQSGKRPQSAMDIRAAYLAGERAAAENVATSAATAVAVSCPAQSSAVAITMEPVTPPPASAANKRMSWRRKPSIDGGGVLPLVTSPPSRIVLRKQAPPPLQPTYERLPPRGYAWNPTDPVSVPLPESPASPHSRYNQQHSRSASEASNATQPRGLLPLRLIERSRQFSFSNPSTVSSENCDTASYASDKGKGKLEQDDAHSTSPRAGTDFVIVEGHEEDLVAISPRNAEWNAAATARQYYTGKATAPDRRPLSEYARSPLTSPLFESEEEGLSSRTAPTTPNDTPLLNRDNHYEDEDEPVQVSLSRSFKERKGRLHGLGVDLTGGDDCTLPRRSSRSQPPIIRRPGHAAIPSLSISPPDEEDEYDVESSSGASEDSVADPMVSPSRRLSNRFSDSYHRRPVSYHRLGQSISSPPLPFALPSSAGSSYDSAHGRTSAPLQLSSPPDVEAKRFSWTPAPLQLVIDQLQRATGLASGLATAPSPARQVTARHGSLAGSASTMQSYSRERRTPLQVLSDLSPLPGTILDQTIPAKLAFIAGFIFGPWCWIIGGWWLRHTDGEVVGQRGARCRDDGCNCGFMLQLFGGSRRRHAAQAAAAQNLAGGGIMDVAEWAGLDQWVFWNRVAAVGSGSVVAALVGVAVWAAI